MELSLRPAAPRKTSTVNLNRSSRGSGPDALPPNVLSVEPAGRTPLTSPEESELIPFDNLTEELVISWVQDKLGEEQVASIQSSLISQIEEQKTPSKLSGVPW